MNTGSTRAAPFPRALGDALASSWRPGPERLHHTAHFWAEQAIKSATIYLAVGLLLRTNHRILVIYGVLSFWNFVSHMNFRLGFGPARGSF